MTSASPSPLRGKLAALVAPLSADAPMDVVERHEETLKRLLGDVFERGVTGDDGRAIAAFQRDVGLIMKYKPYAVKASTPLGYSVFLQEPHRGFSFQKHTVRKVEAFHILDAGPGGFVFLCPWSEWERLYEPDRFQRWLDGAPDDAYERFRLEPTVGDVYLITDRETVHTVVGCRIEEFASVSVDVVNRLHDQNRGTTVPAKFTRAHTVAELATLREPAHHRSVDTSGRATTIQPSVSSGVEAHMLVDCPELQATIWKLAPGSTTPVMEVARDRGVQLFVATGTCGVMIGERAELESGSIAPVVVNGPGTTLIAPRLHFAIFNDGREPLAVSMHSVPWRPAIETLDA